MYHKFISTGTRTYRESAHTCTEHFEKTKPGVRPLPAITSPNNFIRRVEEPGARQNTARATSSL